jgi:hypothetical protein
VVEGCGCGLCTVREPCRVSSSGTGAGVSLLVNDADEVFVQLEILVDCHQAAGVEVWSQRYTKGGPTIVGFGTKAFSACLYQNQTCFLRRNQL